MHALRAARRSLCRVYDGSLAPGEFCNDPPRMSGPVGMLVHATSDALGNGGPEAMLAFDNIDLLGNFHLLQAHATSEGLIHFAAQSRCKQRW